MVGVELDAPDGELAGGNAEIAPLVRVVAVKISARGPISVDESALPNRVDSCHGAAVPIDSESKDHARSGDQKFVRIGLDDDSPVRSRHFFFRGGANRNRRRLCEADVEGVAAKRDSAQGATTGPIFGVFTGAASPTNCVRELLP